MMTTECTDIRQSSLYANFMQSIGWQVVNIDQSNVFIKPFGIFGSIIKLQRPRTLPTPENIRNLLQKYRARSISIEPHLNVPPTTDNARLQLNPFLPTKTIHIDLTPSENIVFNRLIESKRRAVRRAQNLGVTIELSPNIDAFIKLKNRSAGLFGFMTTKTVRPLWDVFAPHNALLLMASTPVQKNVAGILLLFWDRIAYYWMAVSTTVGNQHFAPTLLVWEALRLAKKKGCLLFDFEGIYDERYPHLNRNWLGFTKFKQGFGGKEVYYPKPYALQ